MESLDCLFCARRNPGDAKFCNECGTPLHLRPCPYCDAVNTRTSDRCYRCEAALSPEPDMPAQVAPATSVATDAPVAVIDPNRTIEELRRAWRESQPAFADASSAPVVGMPAASSPARMSGTASPLVTNAALETPATDADGVDASSPTSFERRVNDQPAVDAAWVADDAVATTFDASGPVVLAANDTPPSSRDPRLDAIASDAGGDGAVHWHVDAAQLPDPDAAAAAPPPEYRPARPRVAVVVALVVVALAVPAAIYVARHPETVDARLAELARLVGTSPEPDAATMQDAPATPLSDSATAVEPPTPGAVAPPASEPATAAPATIEAPVASERPAEAASPLVAPSAEQGVSAQAVPAPATSIAPRAAARDTPASGAARRAAPSRGEAQRSDRRTRNTQRSAPSQKQQRRSAADGGREEACTPAVAALGLCNP